MKKSILFSLFCVTIIATIVTITFKQELQAMKSNSYETRIHYAEQLYPFAMFYYGVTSYLKESEIEYLSSFMNGVKIGIEKRAIYEDNSELVFDDLKKFYDDDTIEHLRSTITEMKSSTFELISLLDGYEKEKLSKERDNIVNRLDKIHIMIYPSANNSLEQINLYNIIVQPEEISKRYAKEQIDHYLDQLNRSIKNIMIN